jgi:hypothetical protein
VILSQTAGSTEKLWVNPVNFRFQSLKAHEVSELITPGFLKKMTPGLTKGQKAFGMLDCP